MSMTTTKSVHPHEMDKTWYLIDATDVVLGRMASRVARILMGKHKPSYTPHADTGDFVVITNAAKVKLTGKKLETKKYYHHSGYPGGLKERSIEKLMAEGPEEVIQLAVRRMLPKTKLGRKMIKKLKVYSGEEHPHGAQMPETLDVKNVL